MDIRKLLLKSVLALAGILMFYYCLTYSIAPSSIASSAAIAQTIDSDPHLVLEAGGHQAVIRALLFTADGRELISVGDDKTIRKWSVSPDGKTIDLEGTIRGQVEDGRGGQIAAAALSPPDDKGLQRWLAIGGYLAGQTVERDAIRLHDFASGEVQALLKGHTDNVLALSFSPSGRWLASAGKDHSILLWDLSALQGHHMGKSPVVLTGHTARITGLAWSSTGSRLASASYDGTIGLWNCGQLEQEKVQLLSRLKGHSGKVRSVAFHPDGKVLISGGQDRKIRHWQAKDGKSLGVLTKAKHPISALAFSPDGKLIVSGNFTPPKPKYLTLFSYPAGKTHLLFRGHDNLVAATAFHPNGSWLASGGGDHKEIILWRARNGEILSRIEGKGRTIYAVGFSKEGRYITWGQTSNFVSNTDRGPLEHRFDLLLLDRLAGGIPNSKSVRAQDRLGKLSLSAESGGPYNYDNRLCVKQGRKKLGKIERGKDDGYWHSAYTFTPDGQSVLSGGQNGELRLYSLDAKTRARLIGHTGEIKAVAVSSNGQWALSGSNDQTLKLWDLSTISSSENGQIMPAITLFPTADSEWIAWTPEGYFVSSPKGANHIGYSVNMGPMETAKYVSVDQLYDRFYRPDLVFTKLHGDPKDLWLLKEASTNVKEVIAGGLAPRIAFLNPIEDADVDQQMINVQASIMDQGGGIGKVVWRINDTTVATDSTADSSVSRLANAGQETSKIETVTLKQKLSLLPGVNTIKLIAYNKRNEIASPPVVLNLTVKSPLEPAKPLITPPVSTETGPPPDTGSPTETAALDSSIKPASKGKDAASMHPTLHLLVVGINQYRDKSLRLRYAVQDGQAIVDIISQTGATLFGDVRVTSLFDDQVTIGGLEQAFSELKESITPQDVFMFYLAGHGVTLDGRYYFLPQDFRYYNDEAVRENAVNQDHLQIWLSSIPARKSLVLIDTCESGSFSQSMVAMRGMAEKTAIAKLTRATGRATIVASTDEQPAAEGYQGHGVFTYVLIQGLRYADQEFGNRDGYTGLFELAAYVNDQVPTITMNAFNFEQVPQVHMVGTDFPIGVVRTTES
ncbi:MAG: caspase family protein [Thermodesulfobacteriota bacterium]